MKRVLLEDVEAFKARVTTTSRGGILGVGAALDEFLSRVELREKALALEPNKSAEKPKIITVD